MSAMRCRVLRPFQGDRQYQPGEEVDASDWRNAQALIGQRYLQPLAVEIIREREVRREARHA